MAYLVVKVIERCNNAIQNCNLDLSSCDLLQIPNAIFHLLRDTQLQACSLCGNRLTFISPKFAWSFEFITDLDLSQNQLSGLPDEFANLSAIRTLNISNNSFREIPNVVFKLQMLVSLFVQYNNILEIQIEDLIKNDCLTLVDLRENPISRNCRDKVKVFKTPFLLMISDIVEKDC